MNTETKLAHMQRQIRLIKIVGGAGAIFILIGGIWIIVNGLRGSSIVGYGSPGGGTTVIGDPPPPPPPEVNPLEHWTWEMKGFEKYFKILDKEYQPDKKRLHFRCESKYDFNKRVIFPGRTFKLQFYKLNNTRLGTFSSTFGDAVWQFIPILPSRGEKVDVYLNTGWCVETLFDSNSLGEPNSSLIKKVVIEYSRS